MSTEHKIPERFLAGETAAVEDALRRGIWAALLSHRQAGGILASWEGGRVVFVPASNVYELEPRPGREICRDNSVLERKYERRSLLSNVMSVYVEGETFHVVYSNRKREPYLYTPPDHFTSELRQICRELTGRDMVIRVVEEGAPEGQGLLLELPKPAPRAEAPLGEDAGPLRVVGVRQPEARPGTTFGSKPGGAAGDAPSRRDG